MHRILKLLLIAFGGLIVLLLAALGFTLRTAPGHSLIAGFAEDAASAALGGPVQIGRLEGALPGRIILRDVVLADAEGVFASIDEADMTWRPFKALSGEIHVETLSVNGGMLARLPAGDDKEEEDAPRVLKLPEDLPRIRVDNFAIRDFDVAVANGDERVEGDGQFAIGGRTIFADLKIDSARAGDLIELRAEVAPDAETVFLDAIIMATPAGPIAALAGVDGTVTLKSTPQSSMSAATFIIAADSPALGALEATANLNLTDINGAAIAARFAAGPDFAGVEELASPVAIDASIENTDGGGAVVLNALTSAVGVIAGDARWRGGRNGVETLNVSLKADFADDYRADIQQLIGDQATIVADLTAGKDDYGLDATIATPRFEAIVADARTDLRDRFDGALSVVADRFDLDGKTFRIAAAGDAALRFSEMLAAPRMTVTIDDAQVFDGSASFAVESNRIDAEGDIALPASLAAAFVDGLDLTGPVTGAISASGAADQFAVTANLIAPAGRYNETATPRLNIVADLAGLPAKPNGDVAIRAADGSGSATARLRSSADGTLRVEGLNYAGRNFRLSGDAAIRDQSIAVKLAYAGDDGATPWPGVSAVGAATADVALDRSGGANRIDIRTDALRINDLGLTAANIAGAGPGNALRATLQLGALETADSKPVEDLSAVVDVDMTGDLRLSVQSFAALVSGVRAVARAPATITLADGAVIDNLRLAWGDRGTVAFDGAFSPKRWRGDATLNDFLLPATDSVLDLKFNMDTDRRAIGDGAFSIRSLLSDDEGAALGGVFRWDGAALAIRDDRANAAAVINVNLPLKLTRTDGLGVELAGPLDGEIRYDGQIDTVALYLPPMLQSLEGALKADFILGGTLDAPNVSGGAAISDGVYTEPNTGLSLIGISLKADASYQAGASRIRIDGGARGGGQSGADTLTFGGDIRLDDDPSIDLAFAMREAELTAYPVNKVRANGDIAITGPLDAIAMTGDIVIEELDAEIITPESTGLVDIEVVRYDSATPPAPLTPRDNAGAGAGVDINLTIKADDRIFIRGRGLESEWTADVAIADDGAEPLVDGSVRLRRGYLEFAGRRFDLTRGAIRFDRLDKNNPILDIRAEYETPDDVVAAIVISGRAKSPSIALESTPTLPSEDIMALVLFGKPASELTAIESLQTAQALASLGGVGPFAGGGGGLTGSLRSAVGLDLLTVDLDPENGGGSLTVGKYVTDGVFIQASQDAQGNNGSVTVQYEVTDNIVVETELEQNGDQTVSANWKKDF